MDVVHYVISVRQAPNYVIQYYEAMSEDSEQQLKVPGLST